MSKLTLRQHLEAIRLQHSDPDSISDGFPEHSCDDCGREMPCLSRKHADDALAILDDAHRCDTWGNDPGDPNDRLVPDPQPLSHGEMPA